MSEKDDFFVTDKLQGSYALRIPIITEELIDRLPKRFKKKLNEEIMVVMARIIHESRFDPQLYLTSSNL